MEGAKEGLRFSVSMCVYGGDDSDHFDAALNSVIDQTVRPSEVVLTVDGPVPESIEAVIEKYRNILPDLAVAFKVVYLEKNMGHGEARRISFDQCTCDLIALMDADDLAVPERFEKQLAYYARYPELSAVGGYIREFVGMPENGAGKRIVPETDKDIKEYMKKRCPMNQVTVMLRKKAVREVGGYLDWYCNEDYYLWIRLALAGYQFGNVREKLVDVRVGEETYRRRGGLKYFKSEAGLQRFMLKKKVIGFGRYVINISERLILQVLMPNKLRRYLYQKLARQNESIK